MRVAILATDSREHFRRYQEPLPSFGAAPEALLQGFEELAEAEIHVLSCTQEKTVAPEKIAPNVFYHSLLVPKRGWLRTGYQGCIRAVRSKLHEIRPDIVHGQGTERECGIATVFSGFPSVVTIHGNMAELCRLHRARPLSYFWCAAQIEDFTLRRANGVFCNSGYTQELVKPRTSRTWKVPNAVRMEFLDTPKNGSDSSRSRAINVGVVSPRKQQVELLEAAREIHLRHPEFQLDFVGTTDPLDSYAREFLNRIQDRKQYPYARYLGTMNTRQLIAAFDQASMLLHFPFEEAFGLVVVEALSRGLKVFASRVGGIVDIAQPMPSVSLLPPGEWRLAADAVGAWIETNRSPSKNPSPLLSNLYHPRAIARRHLEIYQEVLSGARLAT